MNVSETGVLSKNSGDPNPSDRGKRCAKAPHSRADGKRMRSEDAWHRLEDKVGFVTIKPLRGNLVGYLVDAFVRSYAGSTRIFSRCAGLQDIRTRCAM